MLKCHNSYAEGTSLVYISVNHNTLLLSGALDQKAAFDAVRCENWVLWRASGPKVEDVRGSCRELHNEDLRGLRTYLLTYLLHGAESFLRS